MELNVDKQATIKPLPVSDYELSPEAAAKIAKTEAEIKSQETTYTETYYYWRKYRKSFGFYSRYGLITGNNFRTQTFFQSKRAF